MVFRFGLNLGDVLIDEERIYGDGVNLAARIQALAEPGAICVSDGFYEQIRGKLDLQFDDLGRKNLKQLSVKEIGEQFGVNHLIDGGIHRIGEKVRITVRLVDTTNARQVWAKRFDCGLDDIFAVQDQITSEILIALDVHLVSGKVGRILRQALTDPDAVESYFRGWGALFRSSRADIYLAQEMGEETIRLSPVFPPFYSTVLASALFGEGRYEEAIATAEVSLAIDSRNLDALLLVAGANAALSRMNDARLATKRILSLKPRFSVDAYFEPQPYRHPRDVEERISLLRKAGLTD